MSIIERAKSLVPVEGKPTRSVTFPEWCALVGTTTGAMAEAQERAEAEGWDSDPIGRCPQCGRPVYTVPGYCGGCEGA